MSASSTRPKKFMPVSLESNRALFPGIRLPELLRLLTGGVLLFMGGGNLLWAFEKSQILDVPDPVFGIAARYLVLLTGVVEMGLGWSCLFAEKRTPVFWMIGWASLNLIVYRCGLWTMGWHHPFVGIHQIGQFLALAPRLTDAIFFALSLFPCLGWALMIWLERSKIQALASMKISCPECGGHVKFNLVNEGQTIPCPHCAKPLKLRREENLKMNCFFCEGHISFPVHSIGTKMPCPHCRKDITLKEPN